MNLSKCFLLFIIYSFLGWFIEVICQLINRKKYVNRGFLIGPYCPIYGFGVVFMIALLTRFLSNPILLFIMSILICSILEYFTSYVMEKMFNARWWDYSEKKYNLNGRICLNTLIPFGIGGMFVLYFINPLIMKGINLIPSNILNIISILILILFLVDVIISTNIIIGFRNVTFCEEKDNTIEITQKVKEILKNKSKLKGRLVKSFPNLKVRQKKRKK